MFHLKQEIRRKDNKEKKQNKPSPHKVSEDTFVRLQKEFEDAKLSFAGQKERLEEQITALVKQLKEQDKEMESFRGNYELEKKSQKALNKEALDLRKNSTSSTKRRNITKQDKKNLLFSLKNRKSRFVQKNKSTKNLKRNSSSTIIFM